MDLSTVARACLRRFYVVVLVLGFAGYAAVQLYDDAAPQYTVSASVVVVQSPSLTLVRAGGPSANPFATGAGSTTLATLLADTLSTRTVQADVLPAGSLLAADWDSETSQLVSLTTASSSAAGAQAAMDAVLAQVGPLLDDIQQRAGAPVDQLYTASGGAPVDVPVLTYPDRLRMVVATVLAGLIVAVLLAVVLDSLLLRRAVRAHRHAAQGDDEPSSGRLSAEPVAADTDGAGSRSDVGAEQQEDPAAELVDAPTVMHRWDGADSSLGQAARVQRTLPPLPPGRQSRRDDVDGHDRE